MDELLNSLIDEGIVSTESYITPIEFGNAVTNSKGFCVIKSFEVIIDR